MWRVCVVLLVNIFTLVFATYDIDVNSLNAITTSTFAIWPNATVPFFVEPQHFDHEQTLSILTALSMFAFKTCLKFKPVMARPMSNEEVLVFINPEGIKRCSVEPRGHSVFTPHLITLGYDCLKSPQIDMMLMKALGFPFEHNRITRDMYIEVLHENIEPGAVEFFTKEDTLPLELRFLPYDINSVMHFGNREYSKNGHRTILFKDPNAQQNRVGLSTTDLKKIEMIYGPECRARDRQEKIELCQSYPGVARKKREADSNMLNNVEPKPANLRKKRDADTSATKNLRVNPNITPPPANNTDDITETLKELGVDHEVQEIVEQIYKVSALALKNARGKYCHNNDTPITAGGDIKKNRNTSDILGIIELVAAYTRDMVDDALKNLTKFCEESESMPVYQRRGCDWGSRDPRCRDTYRSTKSGPVKHSTQHRPVYVQSTKHKGGDYKHYLYGRARNDTNEETDITPSNVEKETTPSNVEKETTPSIVRRKRDSPIETPADENDGTNKQETGKVFQPAVENLKANDEKKDVGDVKGGGSKENEKEAVKKNNGEHVEHKAEETESKKEETENEAAEKNYTNENKDEVKVQNDEKDDDKQSLRTRTQLPGLHDRDTGRYNRRSGKKHRVKRINQNPIEEEYDSMDAETETPKKGKLKKKAAKKNHAEAVNKDKKQENDKLEEKNPKETKREDRALKRKSKKKTLKERQVKSEESVIDDENVGISKESEIEEKPKTKKRVKNRQRNDERMVTIAEEDDEKSNTPQHKTRKEKRRGSLPTTVKLSKKNEEFYNERRWPQGRVNYIISDEQNYDLTEMRKRLAQVNSILKKKTCVSLNEITPGQANKYEDYIVIDSSPDYVTGRVGGKQKFGAIELFQGGQHRQHTAMMVMAMLGFYFEVARHDRDKYIRVHMRHVRPDKLHHFEMIRSDATLPLAYDYASATHPAWQFWRQLGRSGISTVATYKEKDPDGTVMKSLGQNKKLLSDIDIVKINSVYGIKCFQNPRANIDINLKQNNQSTPMLE